MFRPDKKLKRKKQYKNFRKKTNILQEWQREQINRDKAGLPMKRSPVEYPKSKKFTPPKKI